MSIELLTLLIGLTFLLLLMTGLPLAWAMGATSVLFTLFLFAPATLIVFVGRMFSSIMMSYTLLAIPLFVLMAAILEHSGVTEQLFHAVHVWSGRLRGGLAVGTIVSCTLMAAMVGVVGAEIITFGLLAVPEMLKRGYDKRLALGSVCAGGGMATLIPSSRHSSSMECSQIRGSGSFLLQEYSLGWFWLRFSLLIFFLAALIKPEWAPPAPLAERNIPLSRKVWMLRELILPALLAAGVLGSIYAGVATPTEAGALGCIGAILSAAINRRLTWKLFVDSLFQTVLVSCFIAWLFFGAQALIGVYTLAGGDDFVRSAITSLPYGKWGAIIGMQLIWIFLGMFLDWIGILFLTIPLFLPIILDMGLSSLLVWRSLLHEHAYRLSISTVWTFRIQYLKSVTPAGITTLDIYKSVMPYLWLTFLALALTMICPNCRSGCLPK